MEEEKQTSAGTKFLAMVQRDFSWIVVTFILLICMLALAVMVAENENQCDARYADFVYACYQATGKLPSDAAYNLSNFNLSNRSDGEYWQVIQ